MQDRPKTDGNDAALVYKYKLDAAPEKVWRAVTEPEHLAKWLPEATLGADADKEMALTRLADVPGAKVTYAVAERGEPFLDSLLTFEVKAEKDGGTTLRIVHAVSARRTLPEPVSAANGNTFMMRAA